MDFIHRINDYRGLRDVKFIIYRLIWKYRLSKAFDEMCYWMEWNDEKCCWIMKQHNTNTTYDSFKEYLFNYRKLNEIIFTVINRCRFKKSHLEHFCVPLPYGDGYVVLPKRYRRTSQISAKLY